MCQHAEVVPVGRRQPRQCECEATHLPPHAFGSLRGCCGSCDPAAISLRPVLLATVCCIREFPAAGRAGNTPWMVRSGAALSIAGSCRSSTAAAAAEVIARTAASNIGSAATLSAACLCLNCRIASIYRLRWQRFTCTVDMGRCPQCEKPLHVALILVRRLLVSAVCA